VALVAASSGVARAAPPGRVTCRACIIVDDTGRTLFARAPHLRLANASTTKMATALVVVQTADLHAVVVVSPDAAAVGGGGLDLDAGDVYRVSDLLYALLLTSSNEAAVALAEHVAGSETAFVEAMNALVTRLGATDTHFVTSHGLDAPGHYSSAADLALIAAALLRRPTLARIVATPAARIEGPGGTELIENRNVLLETYRGAIGVKTGYTTNAGNVLVAAARRSGRTLIAVAMHADDAAADSRLLLDYGFERLRHTILLPARAPVGELVFDAAGSTPAIAAGTVRGIADPRATVISFTPLAGVRPPLDPGDTIGTVVVSTSRRTIATVDALAGEPLRHSSTSWVAALLGALLRAVALIADKRVVL
jgi:D-alanyl-D-alanine carboxypeptidase (penicillin-binding protein 5/6)